MKLSILLPIVIIVLAVTRPNTVNCRGYPSQARAIDEPINELKLKVIDEPIKGLKFRIMKEKANNVFRILIGGQVHTMTSGPSEKGPGH